MKQSVGWAGSGNPMGLTRDVLVIDSIAAFMHARDYRTSVTRVRLGRCGLIPQVALRRHSREPFH